MTAAQRKFDEAVRHVAARHRLWITVGDQAALPRGDKATIRGDVTDLRLDPGGDFSGRRRRLFVEDGWGRATLLAKVRPAPRESNRPGSIVRFARDREGRRIPLWYLDRRRRVLQLLVDARNAVHAGPPGRAPGAAPPGTWLLEEPVSRLLADEAAPRVGPEVAKGVEGLVRVHQARKRQRLSRELSLLEDALQAGPLSEWLARRLRDLRGILTRLDADPVEGRPAGGRRCASREVTRLRKLVEGRTFSFVRVAEPVVEGVVNPFYYGGYRFRALRFRLRLGQSDPWSPNLRVWGAGKPAPRSGECLGVEAPKIWQRLHLDADVYGMLDFVMTFIETNRVGEPERVTLPEEPPAPWCRSSLTRWLQHP